MGRTKNSVRNAIVSTTGQLVQIFIQFACRTVFIAQLSAEYLGINGLFTNILGILSLAELGFGAAIVYSMYKPIAENKQDEIIKLMNLYKYLYRIVAIIVLIAGISLLPFLEHFIKGQLDIQNLKLIFIIFVFNTVFSYLLIYKKSIIDANQKKYITVSYEKTFIVIQNIIQIIILLMTSNYIFYLLTQTVIGITTNVLISKRADKMYPFLKNDKKSLPNKDTIRGILKNTKAMFFHKIGGVVVNGTDNLLMSSMVSIASVGLYSNYYLITSNLTSFVYLFFDAFTASIGNLGTSETKDKLLRTFRTMNFMGFWIYSFCAVALFTLFNPFINLWIGSEYLFTTEIVLLIAINFYLAGMRQVTLKFRDALGLFWYDRYKPLFEVLINLVASIVLTINFGIVGIFIGTAISTLTTSFWVEPYILFKYGFKKKVN